MSDRPVMSRRQALRLAGLTGVTALMAACAPASAPAPTAAPAKPAEAKPTTAPAVPAIAPTAAPAAKTAPTGAGAMSDADWEKLVQAARQEGTVNVATYAGTSNRKTMDSFEAAYPGIKVEHSQFQSSSRDFVPRLLPELKAGLHSWDIAFMPLQEMIRQVKPVGGLDPIRPLLVRADVIDDRSWIDSFELGFPDDDRKWAYAVTRSPIQSTFINTDLVKDGEVTKFTDILDPKWRGKILGGDPRTKGSAFLAATAMRVKNGGDDIMRQLYKDQEVTLSTDARQLTEFMVRGRLSIGVGAIDIPILKDFKAQGLGNNVKWVPMLETDYVNASNRTAWLLKDALHPNAAKVFINWILSKEGSEVVSKNVEDNSRRADVPVFDKELEIKKGVEYVFVDSEAMLEEIEKTQAIAKELLN